MFIDGFGFTSYRSFGDELQLIGPCSKINLLIGQNNSGKSNVLTFLYKYFRDILNATYPKSKPQWRIEGIDLHFESKEPFKFVIGQCVNNEEYWDHLIKIYPGIKEGNYEHSIKKILTSRTLDGGLIKQRRGKTEMAWFQYESSGSLPSGKLSISQKVIDSIAHENLFHENRWGSIWQDIKKRSGGSLNNWISDLVEVLNPAVFLRTKLNTIKFIRAIRQVSDSNSESEDYSGSGLIYRLAQLQNPDHSQQEDKKRFQEIVDFLQTVTDNPSATLEIPYDQSNILVHMDGRTLPLDSLGTGIHEVIILAAAATVIRESIVCIEEPEIHLHPLLQRKLLRYLNEHTDNQYFIATHSAHLLDTDGASIFHVRHQNGASTVDPVYTASDKALICADLGYRASDLLQANCIIWVEGPSDRIYLNHWIRAQDDELIEGIHYSIMFYGGRLLSHLSADDPDVEDFISLRRLNRYISIVIDSDKGSPSSHVNKTKKRIRDEFNKGPGFAWITKGREIENYVPSTLLESAVKKVHKDVKELNSTDPFEHALHYKKRRSREVHENVDKVKVAREVAKEEAVLDFLDLQKQVKKLVKFIRNSNDL